jgi:hypothetical protein
MFKESILNRWDIFAGRDRYRKERVTMDVNPKLAAFLALHRDAVALFQSTTTPDSIMYEEAEDIVYEQAKKTLERAMKDFGCA